MKAVRAGRWTFFLCIPLSIATVVVAVVMLPPIAALCFCLLQLNIWGLTIAHGPSSPCELGLTRKPQYDIDNEAS